MKRRYRGCLLLVTLFLSSLVPVSFIPVYGKPSVPLKVTRVVWGEDPDSPIKAYPGDEGVALTVEAQNYSPNETIKGVTANLMLKDGLFTDIYGNSNVTATGEPTISDVLNPTDEILPKGFFTLTFSLDINENALPRAYSYNMVVDYSVNRTGIVLEGEPQTLTIEFTVSKIESTVTCSVSPQSVEKGETVDVSGSIDPVRENVTVTLVYKTNGSNFSKSLQTDAEGSYRHSYQPDIDGSWSVNASWLGDEKHEGDWVSASFEVRSPVSLSVVTSDDRLIGGFDNKFNITLLNDGGVPLSTVDVTLSNIPSPLIVHGVNHWTFEYLEPGNSTSIIVEIYVPDSSIGTTYSGSLDLNYRDDYGESHSDSYPIGLIIVGRIELVVYGKSVDPLPASPGSRVSITATLLNKGNIAAMYVNASIIPNEVFDLTAESTTYVGEVEENSQTPFALAVNVNINAQDGTYPVSLNITHRDDQYVDHSFHVTVHVIVEKAPEDQTGSGGTGGFLSPLSEVGLVLVTLIGASAVILFLYRRRFSGQFKNQTSLRKTVG